MKTLLLESAATTAGQRSHLVATIRGSVNRVFWQHYVEPSPMLFPQRTRDDDQAHSPREHFILPQPLNYFSICRRGDIRGSFFVTPWAGACRKLGHGTWVARQAPPNWNPIFPFKPGPLRFARGASGLSKLDDWQKEIVGAGGCRTRRMTVDFERMLARVKRVNLFT